MAGIGLHGKGKAGLASQAVNAQGGRSGGRSSEVKEEQGFPKECLKPVFPAQESAVVTGKPPANLAP